MSRDLGAALGARSPHERPLGLSVGDLGEHRHRVVGIAERDPDLLPTALQVVFFSGGVFVSWTWPHSPQVTSRPGSVSRSGTRYSP